MTDADTAAGPFRLAERRGALQSASKWKPSVAVHSSRWNGRHILPAVRAFDASALIVPAVVHEYGAGHAYRANRPPHRISAFRIDACQRPRHRPVLIITCIRSFHHHLSYNHCKYM